MRKTKKRVANVHKAISVIQFKLEGQLIQRNPQFLMENRLLLDKIDWLQKTVSIQGKEYPLEDKYFPTIDPQDPYALSPEEQAVIESLQESFLHSLQLQKHIRFLHTKGHMYQIYNNQLLYHGCVPLQEDGNFASLEIEGIPYSGRALFDKLYSLLHKMHFSSKRSQMHLDYAWYMWSGPLSPLFGKDQMTTFERYFIADKASHVEKKNAYFQQRESKELAQRILEDFGVDSLQHAHIINGHVPVKVKKGESPIKADGKLWVIDGGMAQAYQSVTGIAGYTLLSNSYGFLLASHKPFTNSEKTLLQDTNMNTAVEIVSPDRSTKRLRVRDTDIGTRLNNKIRVLEELLAAYEQKQIKEEPFLH